MFVKQMNGMEWRPEREPAICDWLQLAAKSELMMMMKSRARN